MHCFITPVNLIAICLCLLFLAPASLSLAQTACPPPAVSTFSATHGRPGAYRECGTKALQNSNGEYVVVGYEGDLQNPYNALYFARFDASGQTIGDKNEIFLVENGTLWSLYEGQPAHLLKETQLIEVLSNNQPNGYLVAVTAEQVGATPDVLLVRLDQEGCVVWTRRIVEGGLQIPVGLFQNAAGAFMVFVANDIGGDRFLTLFTVDDSGTLLQGNEYRAAPSIGFNAVSVKLWPGSGFSAPVYAVLGQMIIPDPASTQTHVSLLAIDGNYQVVQNRFTLYDWDFALSDSDETPVDLEPNGGSLVLAGQLQFNSSNRLFLLSTDPFAPGLPPAVDYNYIFDFNDAENEMAMDLVVDAASGNSTLAFVSNDIAIGLPKARTFQASPGGIVLWTKDYGEISRPFGYPFSMTRTQDGGLFKTGMLRGGPAIQEYPLWVDKTDAQGRLDSCQCYQNLALDTINRQVEISVIPAVDTLHPVLLNPIITDCQPFQPDSAYCSLPPLPVDTCTNLSVTATPADTSNHQCCWRLSYENNSPVAPVAVGICTSDGVVIEYDEAADIAVPFKKGGSFNDSLVMIFHEDYSPGTPTPLPAGMVNDFFTFCLANVLNPAQQVAIKWYDAGFNIICEDSLAFNCTPEPEQCLYILADTLICDSLGYKYTVMVKNPLGSGFDIGLIKLNVLGPGGISILPDSILVLPTPLAPGQSATVMFAIAVPVNLAGEEFCFMLSAHEGPLELICCAEVEQCIPFPQCDPCADVSAMIMPADTSLQDTCCYTFTMKNGYSVPDFFDGLEVIILNPGVEFSGIYNTAGLPDWWYDEIVFNKHLFWSNPLGYLPIDTVNLFDFCLEGVTTTDSVYFEVNWWQGDSILCWDTLSVFCPECAVLTQDSVVCTPDGNYEFTFNFINLNGLLLPINAVRIIGDSSKVISPAVGEYAPLGDSVLYGEESIDPVTVVLGGPPAGNPGDTCCITIVFSYLNEDSVNVECCYLEHCFVLPPCNMAHVPECLRDTAFQTDSYPYDIVVTWMVNDGGLFSFFEVERTLLPGGPSVALSPTISAVPGTNFYFTQEPVPPPGTYTYQVLGYTAAGGIVTCDLNTVILDSANRQLPALELFPNPARGQLGIRTAAPGRYTLEVASLDGRSQLRQNLEMKVGETYNLNIHALPAGILLLRLRHEDGAVLLERFVKLE
ncbi:MAG: T9SS type A sorting domain-containing protein [Lewinellaceae bacterium]|nr:T9SS type A sorting domain-containing protein [Phaeodactylibacter sp.]MCB9035802.1 T9SS type A sorting domain-containing protein [Lewinellaceae bacterium]